MTSSRARGSSQGWLRAFAPATIANFGSGFDAFAAALCTVEPHGRTGEKRVPLGDRVSVRRAKRRGIRILAVEGAGGRLPLQPSRNCAGVAAAAVLRASRAPFGLDVVLEKGLPLSSGLGSSAASAAAGAFAAALALGRGEGIEKQDLVIPALAGEHIADGSWHGDNVWASLMGGGIIVASTRPPEILPIESSGDLRWVTVHPDFELPTRRARAVLPARVTLGDAVHQAARFAGLVHAWRTGDRRGIGAGLEDRLAEPRRAKLVPGYEAARRAAMRAGAHGLTFAGAGPSVLALTPAGRERAVGEAIRRAFRAAGLESTALVCAVDPVGAREIRAGGVRAK